MSVAQAGADNPHNAGNRSDWRLGGIGTFGMEVVASLEVDRTLQKRTYEIGAASLIGLD